MFNNETLVAGTVVDPTISIDWSKRLKRNVKIVVTVDDKTYNVSLSLDL